MPFANIPPSLWDEAEFVRLTEKGQLLLLYLVTGPEAQGAAVPGLLVTSVGALADGRRQSTLDVHDTLAELAQEGWVEHDGPNRLIRVPRAPGWSPPGSTNVVRGWWRRWLTLPASALRARQLEPLREVIVGRREWTAVWHETFGSFVTLPPVGQFSQSKQADKGEGSDCNEPHDRPVCLPEGFQKSDSSVVGGMMASGRLPEASRSEIRDPTSEIRDPLGSDPDPEGVRLADGTAPGTTASVYQQARALWALQEELLADMPWGSIPREPTSDDLAVIVSLFRSFKVAQLDHAQRFLARQARNDAAKAQWYNRRSNWSKKQIEFAVDAPLADDSGRMPVRQKRTIGGGSALPP